jgi:N-acetylglucosaminyldiphosphoundecaprenol N-acetyl-beta-D-mannosaminyltransferase
MSHLNRRSVAVLGVPFDNVTMHEAMEVIEEKIDEPGFHQVATANVDFVIHAISNPELQEMLCSCDLIVPDGMPIVWASRLMGSKLKERVAGVDLIPLVAELAARRGYGMYLLGASERSSQKACEVLQERFPTLRIVGRYSPPVSPLSEMDHEMILGRIELAQPHILLVALGHPKQEQWLAMHRHRLKVPLCMGVGASLDFLAGTVSRAPLWMQSAGLEWLYRAAQEPRRLAQRYVSDAVGLARHLPAQVAANAIQPRKLVESGVHTDQFGSTSVISITGNLSGSLLTELGEHLTCALDEGCHIVLDLSRTISLGLDSIGFLVHLAKMMDRRNRQLWLADVPSHVIRLLRAARMDRYLVSAASVRDALYRIRRSEAQGMVIHAPDYLSGDLDVQVELVKSLCRKLVCFSQSTRLSVDYDRVAHF